MCCIKHPIDEPWTNENLINISELLILLLFPFTIVVNIKWFWLYMWAVENLYTIVPEIFVCHCAILLLASLLLMLFNFYKKNYSLPFWKNSIILLNLDRHIDTMHWRETTSEPIRQRHLTCRSYLKITLISRMPFLFFICHLLLLSL